MYDHLQGVRFSFENELTIWALFALPVNSQGQTLIWTKVAQAKQQCLFREDENSGLFIYENEAYICGILIQMHVFLA